jgi:hypothetical protein
MNLMSDMKQKFMDQVNVSHIKYDWDGGHCYSYIEHPLMNVEWEEEGEQDEWDDFTHSWLYENDECPPCQISIVDGVVGSGCGCHDHLNYENDRKEVEDIIMELENHPDNK